jgi:hypothetical protein
MTSRRDGTRTAIASPSIATMRLACHAGTQHMRTARITGAEDTFPRFGAFQRNQTRRSLRDGLPHRHHPLSGFLTLSAAYSRHALAALFHAASARRLSTFRASPTRASRDASRRPMLSCHWTHALLDELGAWQHNPSIVDSNASPDFRALLRPGVRHFPRQRSAARSRCSPGLFPLRGFPAR